MRRCCCKWVYFYIHTLLLMMMMMMHSIMLLYKLFQCPIPAKVTRHTSHVTRHTSHATCSRHTDMPHCVAGAAIFKRMCLSCNKCKSQS